MRKHPQSYHIIILSDKGSNWSGISSGTCNGQEGRGLQESTVSFFSVVDYFPLNFQEFKACTGQTFVLLWQSRRPKGRKQKNCIHTYLHKIVTTELYQPITVLQEKHTYSIPRVVFMVQMQNGQPVYGASFETPSQVFWEDSFKHLILNQKAQESASLRFWAAHNLWIYSPSFSFPPRTKHFPCCAHLLPPGWAGCCKGSLALRLSEDCL